jgi:hypothetical protein
MAAVAAVQFAHASEHHSGKRRMALTREQPSGRYDSQVEADERSALALSAVRKWLHGSWALLFSHADDFASYGFETDRWLMMVRDAFAASEVRPLALAHSTKHSANWVTEVGGRIATYDTRRYPVLRDTSQQVLCEAIMQAGSRFVMILDDALRLRRTFAYDTHDRLPSPIDLVAMAAKLRSAGACNSVNS